MLQPIAHVSTHEQTGDQPTMCRFELRLHAMLVNGMAANPDPITMMGFPPLHRRRSLRVAEPPTRHRVTAARKNPKLVPNIATKVKYIFYRKQAFSLSRAITLKECRESGFWIHSYRPLGITAYGRSKQESLSAFAMELSSAWHWIAQQSDETLTPDALALKRKLIALVASVRPAREVLSELDQDA